MDETDDYDFEVDVAVVGLGSAGENLASTLAGRGLSVVGFEPHRIGGECPFTACMPSKVLLHHAASSQPDWADAKAHRDEVVDHLDDSGHHKQLVDAGVDVVRHRAAIAGANVVVANDMRWHARYVVLATGSGAVVPPIDGLDRDRVWTSDDFMVTGQLPESLVIVGGGAIGCETAAIMAGFGRSVALVEADRALLAGGVDRTVADLLGGHLTDLGVDVHTGADVVEIRHGGPGGEDVVVLGDDSELSGARILLATGQSPRWAGLGLDSVGLEIDGDGPEVDDAFVVGGHDWLRAIGDLDGRSPWTHGANHQAARLAELLCGDTPRANVSDMPNCVFVDPPVASVGLTEDAAAEAGHDVVVGRSRYSDVARFSTDRLFDGAVTVVVDRRDGAILGCSGIGARFDDVISVVTALMVGGTDIDGAARMVIPFPTIAQVLTPAFADAAGQR